MKIDKRLNLVIPVQKSDGSQLFVHSTPISGDVFDTYFLPIAKTFSAIYSEGLGIVSGPRIADKMLRKVATDMGIWEGPGGVQAGLVAEIHRLTNVLTVGAHGWETLPYHLACKQLLDADDVSEIGAAITFFTVASAMHRKADLREILGGAMKLWGARIESQSYMELMNSLRTSTEVASIGVTVAA